MESFLLAVMRIPSEKLLLILAPVAAVLLAFIPAFAAQRKGRSFLAWWLYGAALPVVAWPHALLVGAAPKKCPFCAELIKPEAIVCRYCRRELAPAEELPRIDPLPPEHHFVPVLVPVSTHAPMPAPAPAAIPVAAKTVKVRSVATISPPPTPVDPSPELPPIDPASCKREFLRLALLNARGALSDADFAERRAALVQRVEQPGWASTHMKIGRPTAH